MQSWRCSPAPTSCRFLRRSSVKIIISKVIQTRCSQNAPVQPQRPGGQPGNETWREMQPTPSTAPSPLQLNIVTLARNGEVVPCCDLAAGPWLAQSPRGAYTTARTVGGNTVFELTHHIQRLAHSARLMMQADCDAGKPGAEELQRTFAHLTDAGSLKPLVIATLKAAIAAHAQQAAQQGSAQKAAYMAPALQALLVAGAQQQQQQPDGTSSGRGAAPAIAGAIAGAAAAALPIEKEQGASSPQELKLTVLVTWGPEGADVYAHVSPLPARPQPPVKVQVKGSPRSNALAKDSEWVRQRKALEAGKPPDVHEVLMVEPCGAILEGLSSNFFVVVGGAVQTAGEGVLGGTVRQVVLEVAQREGMPVELRAPRLQEASQWEGAFITSTSRLVLPVGELLAPDWDPPLNWTCPQGGGVVVGRLEQLVLQEIGVRSEPLD